MNTVCTIFNLGQKRNAWYENRNRTTCKGTVYPGAMSQLSNLGYKLSVVCANLLCERHWLGSKISWSIVGGVSLLYGGGFDEAGGGGWFGLSAVKCRLFPWELIFP